MRTKTLSLVFLTLQLVSSSNALSWGREGHEVVVRIAMTMMKPAEKRAAFALLRTHDYNLIGRWADEVKSRATRGWHFVDIPTRYSNYKADRDCRNGDCIIAALEREQAKIGIIHSQQLSAGKLYCIGSIW